MNPASLRERLARTRRDRRRVERELDRLGMVLVRIAAHHERLARGASATGDLAVGPGDTGDAVIRAFDRLVQPGDGESFRNRREALGFLAHGLLDPADGNTSDDGVSFFDRARTYRTTAPVSPPVWRVVSELEGYLGGTREPTDVTGAVRRLVDESESADDFQHLHALVGFAATALRRERSRLLDRLNGSFDGTDVVEPGLLERYLEAVGDDPLEALDEQPVVMLPVRLETRFVAPGTASDDAPTAAGDVADGTHELRIRIYPDQVHVDTHEPALTDEEVRWGENFWTLLWLATHPDPASVETDAPGDRDSDPLGSQRRRDVVAGVDLDEFSTEWHARYGELKERAWRQVVERFGRERAAYVVHALRPDPDDERLADGDEMLAAGDEAESPWAAATVRVPKLRFPVVERRPDDWTAQPTARLLPDRWVAHATWRFEDHDGETTSRQVSIAGRPVSEPLAMGPDPETLGTMADEATGETDTTEDGEIPGVPAGLEWLVDYDEALRAGMAITISADDIGFDPTDRTYAPDDHEYAPVDVVVVGVKHSMSGDESAAALRELLDAHHYADGLEFLEAGTATNNADVPSGYTAADDPVGSMATEIGAPLVEAGDFTDGDRLARALGLSLDDEADHVFAHVGNADRSTDREARHMNNALWPATIGYTLEHLLVDNRWGPDPSLWADAADVDAADAPTDRATEMREGLALLDAYRRHFVRYVRGGGPFPALRIGEQPYGVLPVTPLSSRSGPDATDWLYDPKLLATAVAVDGDEETPEPVTDYTMTAVSDHEEYTFDAAAVDTGSSNDAASSADANDQSGGSDASSAPVEDDRARTDGSGGFAPRRLPRRDDEVVPHRATWLERCAGVWREAVRADAPDESAESADDDTDGSAGPRPVPRVGAGVTLVDVLAMEAVAGDYLRKSVFTDVWTIVQMVAATDDDFTEAEFRRLITEVDDDLTAAEVDAIIEATESAAGDGSHARRLWQLGLELLGARERQRQDIRETLRAYDLTGLDPRVAHFLYEDALAGGPTWRTISGLVDDDVAVNLWLLQQLPYRDLRRMGYREQRAGEGPTAATRQRQALVDEQRARYPGTEPVVQKSLLRALLRFGTMQEFVTGRITLGALYGDPVALGPDPVRPPDVTYPTWFGQLQYHWIPAALAEHPELTGGAPDDFGSGSYLDALEYLRQPGAILSPIPTFGDFTYSLNRLESYPTDRLERLLATTLDVASHRLDAWWTSLATRRLFELRTAQGSWADRHRLEPLSVRLGYRPATTAVGVYESDEGDGGEAGVDDTTPGDTDWISDGVAIEEADFDVDTIAGASEAVTDIDASSGPLAEGDATAGSDPVDPNASTGAIGEVTNDPLVGVGNVDGEAVLGDEPAATWFDDQVELHPGADAAVYVGGYGFVEDLEPDPASGDTEFIHAPSVQHATTAALLRSAHESHEGDALGEALAVDLSADRVRLARGLLEGVRNGQSLGALLGYRFERALHDHPDDLQTYIPSFRQAAPAVMGRLEHGGEPAEGAEAPGSTAAKSDVVDGYRLYEQDQAGELDWGREGLPPDRDVVKAVIDEALARPIDALSDLLTAESVHQLAKGNVERASGSMDTLVDGRVPQDPEVIRSPRSRTGVTHRQLVLFDAPTDGGAPDVPDHWAPSTPVVPDDPDDDLPGTVQARHAAEPALNAWVAELLPDPASVSCTATYRWTDEAGDDHASTTSATLADLALSPLDALYLTQDAARAGTSQLEGRFAYHLRRHPPDDVAAAGSRDAEVELEFATPAADGDLDVAGFLELAGAIRALVLDGRAADAEDLAHPADGLGTGHEPAGVGSVDPARTLATRLYGATARLEDVGADIDARSAAFEGTEDDPNLPALVDAAVAAVTAFAEAAVPARAVPGAEGSRPTPAERYATFERRLTTVVETLVDDGDSSGEDLLDELDRLSDHLPAGPTAPDEHAADLTVEPGVPLEVAGRVVETSDPGTVDVEAWSRSPVASFLARAEDVAVDESGAFDATLDLGDVEAGVPFQVLARADGEVVYGATGRVVGPTPAPEVLDEALSTTLPTLAALLELAHVRDRLAASDGEWMALSAAVADLASTTHPALHDELELLRRLDTAGRTTLDDRAWLAIDAVASLADATGLDWPRVLDGLLAPVDRLGLTDLVVVSVFDGEPTFRRGDDRAAAEVRERLATTDRDPRTLRRGVAAALLDVDPALARYVDATVSDDSAAFVASLEALVHAPGWFPGYLDGFVDDAGGLLYQLSLLLYHADEFEADVDPAGFVTRLATLQGEVAGMDRLDEVLGTDADGRVAFASTLESFLDGPTGAGLEAFLESAGWSAPAAADDAFATAYEADLATAESDTLSSLPATLEVIGGVIDADEPARAVRAGLYETARDRLMWAAYLGVYGSVPVSTVGGDPADEDALVGQLRAAGSRIAERLAAIEVDDASPTAVGIGALAGLGVPALVDRLETALGEPFVVLPPFVPPNAAELGRAFDPARLGEDPLAAETWLQRVAHVRERPAAFREALSYAEAATGTLVRDLIVGQLPETDPGPWVGRDGVEPAPGQVSFVVQAGGDLRLGGTGGGASSFADGLAGVFVDEWVEPVPSATETTGIALNYDDPGARAPQSILLATPPGAEWTEADLRTAVAETLGLAKLRLVDLEALAGVEAIESLNHLLPALWFPRVFDDQPRDPSVNFEVLERHDPGPNAEDWRWIDAFEAVAGLVSFDGSSSGDGEAEGETEGGDGA